MRWHVNPDTFYIKGQITTYFKVTAPDFNQISFDLGTKMQVDSVLFHGKKINFSKPIPDQFQADLGTTIATGIIDSIDVYYQGEPAKEERSFEQQIHADTAIIWTLSEPYGAKDWWPCKQTLVDKADSIDVFVTTPGIFKVASNGLLISTKNEVNNYKTYHWKHRYPIATYLVAIAVTNYAEYTDWVQTSTTDSFPILNYVYPENAEAFREDAKNTVRIMQEFIKLFGPYPFEKEKYGHAQFGFGGGMEHQTMSFMIHLQFYLVVHELAHQYFGDKITCGSWHDTWLNEGFASYCEGLIAQRMLGETEFRKWKLQKLNNVLKEPDGSVYADDTTSMSRFFSARLTYDKGAMVLHMLRYMLGDEVFFQAIRNYLNDPKLMYSFALTEDIKYHFEKVSGTDLSKFFKDWIYSEGHPIYKIHWQQSAGNELYINLTQRPSHESVDHFELPIPIKLWSAGKDTIIYITSTGLNQEIRLNLPVHIDSLNADPDQQLIARYEVINMDQFSGELVKIFPNPINNILFIHLKNKQSHSQSKIRISDISGRIIMDIPVQSQPVIQLNMEAIANGVYLLQFESEAGNFFQKFIKSTE